MILRTSPRAHVRLKNTLNNPSNPNKLALAPACAELP
jgi:hypothetical protein